MSKKEIVTVNIFTDTTCIFYEDGVWKCNHFDKDKFGYWRIEDNTLYYRRNTYKQWYEWAHQSECYIVSAIINHILDNIILS